MQPLEKNFSRLLIFSGVFNIVLAAPLILPEFTAVYFSFLWDVNLFLSLGGTAPIAPQQAVNALLVNTAGIDLVLIGIIVIYAGLAPAKRLFIPVINAAGRTLFAGIIVYYIYTYNIAHIIALIGAIDLIISIGFVYFTLRIRKANKNVNDQ